MILCIDIGNTLTNIGLFSDDGKLEKVLNYRSEKIISTEEIYSSLSLMLKAHNVDLDSIKGAMISCVVPSLEIQYKEVLSNQFKLDVYSISNKIKTGLMLNCDNPKEVGADLIADCVGAKNKYGNSCLIVDMGTANKVILLDDKGNFAGCVIAPGLSISINALVDKASALHEVSLETPNRIIGKNTKDSMNSAFTYGTAYSLMSLVDKAEEEAGYKCKRILTGGYSRFLKHLFNGYIYDENLLLEALFDIYKKNVKEVSK